MCISKDAYTKKQNPGTVHTEGSHTAESSTDGGIKILIFGAAEAGMTHCSVKTFEHLALESVLKKSVFGDQKA